MTGDHFEVFKEDGKWYWALYGGYFPTGPIARSGQGYTTRSNALRSLVPFHKAATGAQGRVEIKKPPVSN